MAKLKTSDLTLDDAKHLGISILSAGQTAALFPGQAVPSLKLAYHTANGKLRRDIYRLRLLEVRPGLFGESPTKPLRYLQPKGSPPAAYFPRTVDWPSLFADPAATLVITEGELKAACASKYGYPTVGLGGVSSWGSKRRGWQLLPELEAVTWLERDVVIAFDSDAADNPEVTAAVARLVHELVVRGARPRVATLPAIDGYDKTGLDDYLVERGPAALGERFDEAEGDELAQRLWSFNARFSFVLDPGFVYDEELNQRHRPTDFVHGAYANVWAVRRSTTAQGAPRLERRPVAKEWVRWPWRRQVRAVTYEPGQPRFVNGKLNTWSGWGCAARAGSVKPWQVLLDHLFEGSHNQDGRRWFEQWCLFPIAYPGTKLLSAVGVWSRSQGQGKSLVGKTLGYVYGNNYSLISQRELESAFNGWAVGKQLVMVDDVSAHDSRAKADVLKKAITQDEIVINVKYVPTYSLPDRVNYYLTSNRANAFYVEDRDRRFFIHEVRVPRKPSRFYRDYHRWLAGDGPSALLQHARSFDFSGFDPHAPPPETRAKREMVDSVKSELGLWLTELRDDPDGQLQLGALRLERDLYTSSELVAIFDQTRRGRPVAANVMGLYLRDYFEPVCDGATVRVNGKSERLYAVRHVKKWVRATRRAVVEHVIELRAIERGGGKF